MKMQLDASGASDRTCLMPSRVSSSRLTKMRMGSVMNLVVISTTSCVIVAERRQTCVLGGR